MYGLTTSVVALLAGAASLVVAAPSADAAAPAKAQACLCASDADYLINAYVELLGNYTDAAANKYLAADFRDTSDSINTLAGIPLGSVTFPTKAAFMGHEETDPDRLPISITMKGPVACNSLAFVWQTTFGAGYPVRGLTILGAERNGGKWQISTLDEEFNNIAFLDDIGGSCSVTPVKGQ